MAKVYVGGIDVKATEADIEDEFNKFGTLRSVWIARKPPGFAFVEFEDSRDADVAIGKLDGFQGWRVELSRKGGPRGGGGGDRYGDRGPPRGGGAGMRSDSTCYNCGEPGHFSRECPREPRERGRGGGGGGRDRDRGYGGRDSGRDGRDGGYGGYGGGGGGGGGRSRYRSRSPVARRSRSPRRSPSYSPRPRRSPSYGRSASRSPRN